MIEQINSELLKLQDELNKFDGAVAKITKTNELSDSLIKSSKELSESFGAHITKIESLFSDYMNKTYSYTNDKVNELFERFHKRQKQEERALERFSILTEKNTELTQEFLETTTTNNKETLDKLLEETQSNMQEEKEFVQMQINGFKKKIDEMLQSHTDKVKSEQQILDNYLELATSTAELSNFLKTVDFPEKLDGLKLQNDELKVQNTELKDLYIEQAKKNAEQAKKIQELTDLTNKVKVSTQKLVDDNTNTEILTKLTKLDNENKQEEILGLSKTVKSKVSGTKLFVVMTFVISLVFYLIMAYVFFSLFPNFIEDIILN